MPGLHDGADALFPNALLILAAIDALNGTGITRSPNTDQVGYALDNSSSWVRRHGKDLVRADHTTPGYAHLSVNGHCFLDSKGIALAALLRSATPITEAPAHCRQCGAEQSGPTFAGRQIYACGRVMQWCPDHVPGSAKPDLPPRSRKAQHSGVWFRAHHCTRQHGQGSRPSLASDGVELIPGSLVSANRGSGFHGRYGNVVGTVVAAANGTVLVDWPALVGDGHAGRPEIAADIVSARHLITPGAPDETGLSDYQQRLWNAIRLNRILLEINEDGSYSGRLDGRKITARALEVLIEHRLLEPPPVPAAIGLTDFRRRLRQALFTGTASFVRTEDGRLSAIFEGRKINPETMEELDRHNLLP